MVTTFSPTTTSLILHHPSFKVFRSNRNPNFIKIRCTGGQGDNSTSNNSSVTTQGSETENLLLKTAWYGSELLGIAASFFRSPQNVVEGSDRSMELAGDGVGVIDHSIIVETIKGDFQRSYFVTGK